MTNSKRTWTAPELKTIDVESTLSRPSPAQAEAQDNSQQHHVPGGPIVATS